MQSIVWLVALAGCYHRIDETTADAPADAIDAPPGCYGHLGVNICQSFTGAMIVPTTIDTDNCAIVVANGTGPNLCVVAAGSLEVKGHVVVRGSRPLLLFAPNQITIDTGSQLDVASHALGPGPGANDSTSCVGVAFSQTSGIGGNGGPGGSFGTLGGKGGGGGNNAGGNNPVNPGGTTGVFYVRGGCRGNNGQLSAKSTAGAGGSGGGAVYLLAGNEISISGAINASGAGGGEVSSSDGGGGGGGSGGLIILDAADITISSGTLIASGGGGGGSSTSATATAGGEPNYLTPNVSAISGYGYTANSGGGGRGSTTASGGDGQPGAIGNVTSFGGGGGGGGAGMIWTYGPPTITGSTFIVPAQQQGS